MSRNKIIIVVVAAILVVVGIWAFTKKGKGIKKDGEAQATELINTAK